MAWQSADDRHEGYVEYVFADGFGGSGWDVDGVMVHTAPSGTWIPYDDRPGVSAAVGDRWMAGGL
ncbi:hypothetical protein OG555_18595 [Kribbella sp. NBC_01484]|uniref:hypothetical protein n=1 Tax=Kribbella sp. NBC_01484 TaxID=2903579 RepID=UPI002E377826|nr:hypothetical protein [Kribbella sp. NBC_01484]